MDTQHLLAFLVCPNGRAEALEGQPEGSRLLAKGHTRKEANDERGMGPRSSAGIDRTTGRAGRDVAEEAAVSTHGLAPHQDVGRQLVVARCGAEKQRAAGGNEDQREDEASRAHDSGALPDGLRGRRSLCLRTAPKRSLHAISDSPRQHVRPLVHRLVGDAYSLGDGGDGSAEEFDGFGFAHAPLNHSSRCFATMVSRPFQPSRYRLTMVEQSRTPYADRLVQAMREAENPYTNVELAEALGITRQAIDKVLKGGSKEMSASNNARAAQLLNVDPTWLATGEGTARPAEFKVRWSERRLIDLYRRLPPDEQDEFARSVESQCAIHEQHSARAERDWPLPEPMGRPGKAQATKAMKAKK